MGLKTNPINQGKKKKNANALGRMYKKIIADKS